MCPAPLLLSVACTVCAGLTHCLSSPLPTHSFPSYVPIAQCFRLYTEAVFETLTPNSVPEVRRVSLATVALRLLAMGVKDIPGFPFLEPPTRQALAKALELLYNLGAIDSRFAGCPLMMHGACVCTRSHMLTHTYPRTPCTGRASR